MIQGCCSYGTHPNLTNIQLKADILILLNLVLIEFILSIPRAVALGTLVSLIPEEKRISTLKFSVIYLLLVKMIALIFASFLIRFAYINLIGSLFLIFLSVQYYFNLLKKKVNRFPTYLIYIFLLFITLIIEFNGFDSMNSVFAAVAFTDNIYLIYSTFIIAMVSIYGVAYWIQNLIKKHPIIQPVGFLVIIIIALDWINKFIKQQIDPTVIESELTNFLFSLITVGVIIICIVYSFLKKNLAF